LLARVCAAQGQKQLALKLWRAADSMSGKSPDEEKWTVRRRLSEKMAVICMWRAILEFEDPKISRETLLKTFQEIARRFPDSRQGPNATGTVRLLESMIREDHAHANSNPKPLNQLTGQERIKELIFQLRDQNGHQYMQPGSCDIFAD